MSLRKLVALSVFVVMLACTVVMWSLFWSMYTAGEYSVTVYANEFGEFWIEFVVLTLAIVFLPVLLFELDAWLQE